MEKHIVPQIHQIKKEDRNQLNGHQSKVLWFTGLSGSGKSTLANLLEQKLHAEGMHTYILDGDNIRAGLNKDLSFSDADRQENIRRIGEVAKLMADAGVLVLTAFISPFRTDRQLVRALMPEGDFVEIFIDCPLEICEQRDVKGLYAKARAGQIKQFTGIDSPFEAPEKPEIHIQSDKISPDEAVIKIYDFLKNELKIFKK